MRYRLFFLLIILFSKTLSYAQTTFEYTDSIKNPAEYHRAKQLFEKAQQFLQQQQVDSTLHYHQRVISIAQQQKFFNLHAEALHSKGRVFLALGEQDSAAKILLEATTYWELAENFTGLNRSLTNIGSIYQDQSRAFEGFRISERAIAAGQKSDNLRGLGIAHFQRGNFATTLGKYSEALEDFQTAIDLFDSIKFDVGVGLCYNNIANIYSTLESHERALEYWMLNLNLQKRNNNRLEYANSAMNIGSYYAGISGAQDEVVENIPRRNVDSMFHYYSLALQIYEEIEFPIGLVQALTNLGIGYISVRDFQNAERVFNRAEQIAKQNNIRRETVRIIRNKALLETSRGNFAKAIELYKQAYQEMVELNLIEEVLMVYKRMSEAYSGLQDYENAYVYFRKYDVLQDSLRQRETISQINVLTEQFGVRLKDQEIESARLREQDLRERNLAQQRFNLVLQISIGIVVIFLIMVFYQFIQKRRANGLLTLRNEEITKQKEEIELQRNQVLQQKDIIEEQQQNILDSIHYASRIQEAILPQDDSIIDLFGSSMFVLFKPRDIVSGDFYWLGKKGNKKIILAADCTGHGVPGAFMSMLGTAFLNEIIISENDDVQAHQILNRLRDYVIVSLKQTGKEGEQKDGMDVSLCVYDEETRMVDFAGANNPLIVVRETLATENFDDNDRIKVQEFISETNSKPFNIIHIQGDKMPIGIYADQKPFSSVHFQLLPGDTIYAFSDGYQDQFGGDKNKKFMIKRLKQLFIDIYSFDMLSQHRLLDKTILNWMKEGETEQIDDILVIGLKIK